MAAPNGARKTKKDHPALPLTVEETVAEALRCHQAGAAILHAHVRDKDGIHILDAGLYKELLAEMKRVAPEMLIQITTEAVGRYTPQHQSDCVRRVMPEMISMAVVEMAGEQRDLPLAKRFYLWAHEAGIHIQHILFSVDDVKRFLELQGQGIIPQDDGCVLFVLGRYSANLQSSPTDLSPLVKAAQGKKLDWFICAFGNKEHECLLTALSQGGHIRVGFENNLLLPSGERAENSAALVSNACASAQRIGRPIADPTLARGLLGIRKS